MRAITRVATPHTEAMLLAIAEGCSAAQIESLVRTCERVGGSDRKRASSEQRRGLSWYYEDGMLIMTAAVPAERGALVIEALQQVIDARKDEGEARCASLLGVTYPGETAEPAADEGSDEAPAKRTGGIDGEAVPAQAEWTAVDVSAETPADLAGGHNGEVVSGPVASAAVSDRVAAIGVSAEMPADHAGGEVSTQPACAAVTDMDASGDVSAETDDLPDWLTFELSSREQRFADALVDMAEHCLASPAGHWKRRRTGRRYEVVLTMDRNQLAKKQSAGGARYHVEPDWGIDEEDARQIAWDADLTEFIQERGATCSTTSAVGGSCRGRCCGH